MKDVITKSSSLDFVLLVFGLLGASIQRLHCMSFYHAMPCKRSAKLRPCRLPCRERVSDGGEGELEDARGQDGMANLASDLGEDR